MFFFFLFRSYTQTRLASCVRFLNYCYIGFFVTAEISDSYVSLFVLPNTMIAKLLQFTAYLKICFVAHALQTIFLHIITDISYVSYFFTAFLFQYMHWFPVKIYVQDIRYSSYISHKYLLCRSWHLHMAVRMSHCPHRKCHLQMYLPYHFPLHLRFLLMA